MAPLLLGAALASIVNHDEHAVHVVQRGDTLWSIVASHLGAEASGQGIAQELPAWYAANPGLADHPDLLLAGDTLIVPSAARMGALTGSLR